ncbi:uncharacterized protein LOC111030409 isoform X2 [Myzus persicae]|uniref:uncharacterized protein LOC111030409 isoform X2 n=1 Tax=Myzus persicae TaxID=13164 RepID=UPI000B934064|nr:uncharacterized protein LOC111030409 isoform X2 [Myzus persicae]
MFWFMFNTFLMISAVSQVHGLKKNSTNISNGFDQTKNDPSVLILKDVHGNTYKYIYPNDMDQFSKMSTLDQPYTRISSTTSERPRTITIPKNTTNQHKRNYTVFLDTNKESPILSKAIIRQIDKDNSTISINSTESTDTITINDGKTENKDDENDPNNEPSIHNISFIGSSDDTPILSKINNEKYERSDEQQNSYKSCDNRNGLILLVENDIKLKLFLNSNGILGKSSLVNSRKNATIKSKDELSTEDVVIENDDEFEFSTSTGVGD